MGSIVLLNQKNYPGEFDLISVTPPAGITMTDYIEERIISALNEHNPKLDVTAVEYLDIRKQFPDFEDEKRNGLLVDEFQIRSEAVSHWQGKGCYVYQNGTDFFCRRILMYLFLSGPQEGTRNVFVPQSVLPAVIDYAERLLHSPCYSMTAHPICLMNMVNKKITAPMIQRHYASLYQMGMDYVEVFGHDSVDARRIPKDLKLFLQKYASDFASNYDAATDAYEYDHYRVAFKDRRFIVKAYPAGKLVSNANGILDFNGSYDKPYWLDVMAMAHFAYDQGYEVDCSALRSFVSTYKPQFSPKSDKMKRCEALLAHLDKYTN